MTKACVCLFGFSSSFFQGRIQRTGRAESCMWRAVLCVWIQFQDNNSWSCWQQQCVLFQSLAFPEIKRQGAGAGNGTAKVHLDGVNKDVQQARWGVENGHVFCRKVIGMGAWQELDQPRWGWLPQVDGQVIRQPGPGSTGGLPNMLCALRAWGNTVGLLC